MSGTLEILCSNKLIALKKIPYQIIVKCTLGDCQMMVLTFSLKKFSRYIKEKIKSAGSDSAHKAGRESPLFCITQTVKGDKIILIYSAVLYI